MVTDGKEMYEKEDEPSNDGEVEKIIKRTKNRKARDTTCRTE